MTLKVSCTLYSASKSSLYALLLIFLRTWKGPSPQGLSLDFLLVGNLSFLRSSQTRSPSSKMISLFPLLLCFIYFSVCCCICSLTLSCIFLTNSTFVALSLCTKVCGLGRGNKTKGVRGLNPYTTSNGEILVM